MHLELESKRMSLSVKMCLASSQRCTANDAGASNQKAATVSVYVAPTEDIMNDSKAFRCRNCGYLESAEHAGESAVPHSCRVCHRGVVFARNVEEAVQHEHCKPHLDALAKSVLRGDFAKHHLQGGRHIPLPAGMPVSKYLIHECWEVLADCDDDRLAELGLSRADVVRHTPGGATRNASAAKIIEASITDGAKSTDSAG